MAEPTAEISGKTSNLPSYSTNTGANKSGKKKNSGTAETRLDYAVSAIKLTNGPDAYPDVSNLKTLFLSNSYFSVSNLALTSRPFNKFRPSTSALTISAASTGLALSQVCVSSSWSIRASQRLKGLISASLLRRSG